MQHSPHRLKPNYPLAGTPPFLDSFMTRWCSCNTAYKSENSRKTGISWARKVTLKLWNIMYQIWIHCNYILHETEAIYQVSGLAKLQQAITTEYTRGPGHLHRVYNSYFSTPLQSLLTSTINNQKQWFHVIRIARESTDLFAYDEFATHPSLRAWVGLPPLPDI